MLDEKKNMLDKQLRKTIYVIAISAAFVAITWALLLTFISTRILIDWNNTEAEDIRRVHIQQHLDEQIKYNEMIKLLEQIKSNTD